MALSDTPKIFFVTFVVLFIGTLFLLIGFATPNWVEFGGLSFGLWQACVATLHGRQCGSLTVLSNTSQNILQAISCFALLLAAGSGVVALAFIPMKTRQKTLANVIAAGCVVRASCNGAALGLFRISNSNVGTFGYSFILSAIATTSLYFASILAFVMAYNIRPENALPTAGVFNTNPQGMHENPQHAGVLYPQAQYNPNTVPGQYGHQQAYAVPGAGAQYPGVNKY